MRKRHIYIHMHTVHAYLCIHMAASVLFRVPKGAIGIDRGTISNAYIIQKYPGGPLIRTPDDTNKTEPPIYGRLKQ